MALRPSGQAPHRPHRVSPPQRLPPDTPAWPPCAAGLGRSLAPPSVQGSGAPLDPRDVQVQRRLDAFLLAMREWFRTRQQSAYAPVPFRMAPGVLRVRTIRRNMGALVASASRAPLSPAVLIASNPGVARPTRSTRWGKP
jgi:hypothetical protein